MTPEDIEFQGEGGLMLRGWLHPATDATTPRPTIVMTHGPAAVKEMHLHDCAECLHQAGLNVVIDPSRAGRLR